jgi:D-glycero-D-manno-heptose 1,7-bisphosphate phosphatase
MTDRHRLRQAVIIVGGKGTRLGALTASTPKPLMTLSGDRVFLDELIDAVARQGFDDIVLVAGYLAEQFIGRYDGKTLRGARLKVVVEDVPAGTAGALIHAKDHLQDTFLFLNGDTLFDINLRALEHLLNDHPDAVGALALRRVPDAGRYGSVRLKGEHISSFEEKRASPDGAEGLINGGIGVFRKSILERIGQLPSSIETDVYPGLCADGRLVGMGFDGYFIDIGLPETLETARRDLPLRRPTLFLDRDGVLNIDKGYTHRIEDLVWVEGARELVRAANDAGALVIVVTNQAGVARGYYGLEDIDRFHGAMQDGLADFGAHVDQFYSCPYHADAQVTAFAHPDHPDRKPNPGMLLQAMADWPVDRSRSILIGDKPSDMQAAEAAGVPGLMFSGGSLSDLTGPVMAAFHSSTTQP